MSTCCVCQSETIFKCNCSLLPTFFCKYHISDHLAHSDFRFIFTKSLKSNLNTTLEFLEGQKVKVKECFYQLNESKKKFVSFVKSVYAESRLQLSKVCKDLDDSIRYLKDLKLMKEYEYFTIFKYVIDPDLQLNNSFVRWVDNTNQIIRKFSNYLKVESITDFLLKSQEGCMFDNEYFEIELEKANVRENAIKMCEGLSRKNEIKPIFTKNMNKTQYNWYSYYNDDSTIHFDVYILKSFYSKKLNRFYIVSPEISDESITKVLKSLFYLEQVDYLYIGNAIKTEEHYHLLFSALKNKRVIKHIKLEENQIMGEHLSTFFDSVNTYKERVETLVLKSNLFSSQGCGIIDIHLQSFKNLKDFDISNNDIKDEGVELIQESLATLKCLEDLNVAGNLLTAVGIKILMKAVTHLPHLSALNVSNNSGLDESALIISEYLKRMRMLMVLSVDYSIRIETEDILRYESYAYTKIIACNERKDVRTIKTPYFEKSIEDLIELN